MSKERLIEVKRHYAPESNYSKTGNSFARGNLSPRGKAVVLYLLSHKDGYHPSKAQMQKDMGMHKNAILGGIDDAEACGYLVRQPVFGHRGGRVNTVYHVADCRFSPEDREKLSEPINAGRADNAHRAGEQWADNAHIGGRITPNIEDHEKTILNNKTILDRPTPDPANSSISPDGSDAEEETRVDDLRGEIISDATRVFGPDEVRRHLPKLWNSVGGSGKIHESQDERRLLQLARKLRGMDMRVSAD
ncbi:helix-turn-helix domain-containing protein [Nocardia cyriacigeorgica]|uniref:helix-turn-helix domain-containing protein n=1 Tax=Nocardia cyriacigeorgica TaxID=135487 RepID=UPI0013D35EE2|nr:helix-turn-helix domain-containing protein [Nocardia cyriacigeorgica]NEW29475.1 helix-turn-helix domain-containing protein [Nocardia cyriacigeorgica]